MKKTLLVIIGILLGIAISLTLSRYQIYPFRPAQGDETHNKKPNIDDLFNMGEMADHVYGFTTKSNLMPMISVRLSGSNLVSQIIVLDNNLNGISLTDEDLDGKWDYWSYIQKDQSFHYNPWSGFPQTASVEGTNILSANDLFVRIDGEYFKAQSADGKYFIEKNNEMYELEEYQPDYYRIKKANQGMDLTR